MSDNGNAASPSEDRMSFHIGDRNMHTNISLPNLDENLSKAPSCAHGPALLFERIKKDGITYKYYACSTCRDRKDCNFFQSAEDSNRKAPSTEKALEINMEIVKSRHTTFSHAEHVERLKKFCQLPDRKRCMCKFCSKIMFPDEIASHKYHGYPETGITCNQLQEPTKLLMPLSKAKKEAQFFFSTCTSNFIVSTLQNLGFHSALCIGCPRIHEQLLMEKTINSFLMDIDQRFYQFYSPSQFCEYNMFNHHFFAGEEGKDNYLTFLRTVPSDKLAVILDPPFGGLIKPVAHSLRRIEAEFMQAELPTGDAESNLKLPVFLVFPYYLEKKILEYLPNFVMLDYQVDYECSHSPNKTGKSKPVHIFTNYVPLRNIVMPTENYKYCDVCERYVLKVNVHCSICGVCPSKNGRPYVHCEKCKCCVKSSYVHCERCGYCLLKEHDCNFKIANEAQLSDKAKRWKGQYETRKRQNARKCQKKEIVEMVQEDLELAK